MPDDAHDSNNAGEPTGSIFPACTPEQNKALARLRALAEIIHVQPVPDCIQIPGNVLEDWARIDAERAELERIARL